MAVFISFLLFLFGASIASFAGLAAHRLRARPVGQSAWAALSGRSHCDGCGAQLTALELVPVLGWLVARGRCARCGHRVPVIYPVSEALVGGGLVAAFLFAGPAALAIALPAVVLVVVLGVVFLAMRGGG
ncbi:prepilin peptidase [Mesorhizobium australicum]|uniref:Peptidase A24 N-terminal domain-containing protein n=1 Tax=Mesorhizobium australicum TaxID=536018 RepID=A0A1X7PHZ1_9HYPH|nr:prepilin peptidase [Mesorhizobium australicum]SMH51157.1 Peptidase A24 N-terminal domain-containing protein [Mesorhizobium australicum]